MKGISWALAVPIAGAALAGSGFPGRDDPSDLVGTTAPPLALTQWVNSEPLEMDRLRGKVVLVRWWTDQCPFCVATASSLRDLQRRHGDRGLVVIGVFHPKPAGDPSPERLREAATRLGLDFPLALDPDWEALRRWWLDRHGGWTSVSFVVDRQGVIRYVHPGGEFHTGGGGPHWNDHSSCNREYREIEDTIARLVRDRPPASP
jgi:peroxiredoxin